MDFWRRIKERNAGDWGRGLYLLLLGGFFVAAVLFIFHKFVFPALVSWIGTGDPALALTAFDASFAFIFLLDLALHGTWPWIHGLIYLTKPGRNKHEPADSEFDDIWAATSPERPIAILRMLPLVAALTDPNNTGMRRLIFVSDLATIPLFGSRVARNGLERILVAMNRGRRRNIDGATKLLSWIKKQEKVTERKLAFQLAIEPEWVSGLALARNLDLLTRRSEDKEKVYRVVGM